MVRKISLWTLFFCSLLFSVAFVLADYDVDTSLGKPRFVLEGLELSTKKVSNKKGQLKKNIIFYALFTYLGPPFSFENSPGKDIGKLTCTFGDGAKQSSDITYRESLPLEQYYPFAIPVSIPLDDSVWNKIKQGNTICEISTYFTENFGGEISDTTITPYERFLGSSIPTKHTLNEADGILTLDILPDEIIPGFQEIGREFDEISHLTDVGGKLAFLAFTKDGQEMLIHDGKIVWRASSDPSRKYRSNTYLQVAKILDWNGKPLLFGDRAGDYLFIYEGKEIWKKLGKYNGIFYNSAQIIGGKLAFKGKKGKQEFVVYDGKTIWKGRENSLDDNYGFPDINGKPAFSVRTKKGTSVVMYDGEKMRKIGNDYHRIFDDNIKNINGKIFFPTEDSSYRTSLYVYDGKEYPLPKDIERIVDVIPFGDVLAFVVEKTGESYRPYVQFHGKEWGSYSVVRDVKMINGKIAFLANTDTEEYLRDNSNERNKPLKYFIVLDGEKIGENYDRVTYFTERDGQLSYIAVRGTEVFHVINGKETLKANFKSVTYWSDEVYKHLEENAITQTQLKGLDAYLASSERMGNIMFIGGKMVILAKENNKPFIVMER